MESSTITSTESPISSTTHRCPRLSTTMFFAQLMPGMK